MNSSLGDFQTAVYDRLSTDANLSAAITGVFDFVPEGQAYPYVTLGENTATDDSTFTTVGQEVTTTLHTWSQYKGFSEVKNIHSLILKAMTASLTVSGWTCAFLMLDMENTLRDPDGITRHGVIRLRYVLTQPK